jgi:hypothetical protein
MSQSSTLYKPGDTLMSNGARLRVKQDVLWLTGWDTQFSLHTGEIPDAHIWESNRTLFGLQADVIESLFACWRLYGCESDERLAEDAQQLKQWVLKHFTAI